MTADSPPPSKPPSREPWYRREYESTRRRVLNEGPARSAKFKIYELVGAFLTMRRREAGIDARVNRAEAQEYEFQTLQGLLHWIQWKDPDVDRLRETLRVVAKGNPEYERTIDEALETFLEDQRRFFSKAQAERAANPRERPFNDYIDAVLKECPNISEKGLLRRIENDEGLDSHPADYIEEVLPNMIWVVDPATGKKEKVERGGIRSRLSRRKEFLKQQSRQPG